MLARALILASLLGLALVVLNLVREWPRAGDRMTATTPQPAEVIGEHFRLDRPAELDEATAEAIYQRLRERMGDRFALSGLPAAAAYQAWRRYNRAPYRSATHGERFVNNYANAAAASYGSGATMPVGAILAKDAFTVTAEGGIHPAALALMEKMAPGFDADGNDWRYVLILPEGDIVGITGDVGDEHVRFCRDCHRTAAGTDFLFLVPEPLRIEPRRRDAARARPPVLLDPAQPQGSAR